MAEESERGEALKLREGQVLRNPVEVTEAGMERKEKGLAGAGHVEPVGPSEGSGLGALGRVFKQGNNTDRFSIVNIPFPSNWDHHRPPPPTQFCSIHQWAP